MKILLFLGPVSVVLSLVFTPIAREFFRRLRIVDRPDQQRKLHRAPTPRAGGLAIVFSYFVTMALALYVAPEGSHLAVQHASIFPWLLIATFLIFVAGLLDDIYGLPPRVKLLIQFWAASIACWGGVRILTISDHAVASWWGVPLTIIWLIACSNAINLIDGLDGLAAGVSLFATLTAMTVAIIQGNIGLVLATVPLAGCLLGFLRYNFSPASVFLGDSGSLTIGFLLGCFAVIWCQKIATFTGLMAPLLSLSIPLLDVSLSVARRFVSKRPIFSADRGHIHHRLLARGYPPKTAALILYAACGATAFLAVSLYMAERSLGSMLLLLASCLAVISIWKLRFVEFEVVKDLVLNGTFRHSVQEGVRLLALQESLGRAASLQDFWTLIVEIGEAEKFQSVQLELPMVTYSQTFHPAATADMWSMAVTLGPQTVLTLTGRHKHEEPLGHVAILHVLRIASLLKVASQKSELLGSAS